MDTEPVRSQPTHIVHLSLDSGEVTPVRRAQPSTDGKKDFDTRTGNRWNLAYRISISTRAQRKYHAMIKVMNQSNSSSK